MEDVSVAVHTQEQVVTGTVSLSRERRLSDFLNSDSFGKSNGSGKFLKLTNATIARGNGEKERAEVIYINREAIQMLRTLENDSARGIGSEVGPKQYPFVKKLPVRTTVCMSGYELSGFLHCTNAQGIPQLLAQEVVFLPLTDAKIRGVDGDSRWNAGFVAINRRQVCSFQHEN
jgi:hypothetical protein